VKVGDMVRQTAERSTVPVGALGMIVDEVVSNDRHPSRFTIMWIAGNEAGENLVTETVGYGYGYEVISES
jgi:hypothetical protein